MPRAATLIRLHTRIEDEPRRTYRLFDQLQAAVSPHRRGRQAAFQRSVAAPEPMRDRPRRRNPLRAPARGDARHHSLRGSQQDRITPPRSDQPVRGPALQGVHTAPVHRGVRPTTGARGHRRRCRRLHR